MRFSARSCHCQEEDQNYGSFPVVTQLAIRAASHLNLVTPKSEDHCRIGGDGVASVCVFGSPTFDPQRKGNIRSRIHSDVGVFGGLTRIVMVCPRWTACGTNGCGLSG